MFSYTMKLPLQNLSIVCSTSFRYSRPCKHCKADQAQPEGGGGATVLGPGNGKGPEMYIPYLYLLSFLIAQQRCDHKSTQH
jgi:hypothetical protein